MKIRTVFVSNSSSSSFLVCYKSNEDLKRFLPFNGAKDFLNDIKECSDKKALELLKECLEDSGIFLELDRDARESGFCSNHFEASPAAKFFHNELISVEDFDFLYGHSSEAKESDYTRVAKHILKTLKKKYSELGFVEYGNEISDREIEYYMEFDFMNFLASDPEKKICVIRKSNH